MNDRILIIDFGSQVTQLIARRIREAGVYCEIVPFNNAENAVAELQAEILDELVQDCDSIEGVDMVLANKLIQERL